MHPVHFTPAAGQIVVDVRAVAVTLGARGAVVRHRHGTCSAAPAPPEDLPPAPEDVPPAPWFLPPAPEAPPAPEPAPEPPAKSRSAARSRAARADRP